MFLTALKQQNPALIDSAITLLERGLILPDTYVIDVDQFRENARLIKVQADNYGIRLYAMTKQFGRNPVLANILIDEFDYAGIVCVDFKEARTMHQAGVKIGHIGHLVQPPSHHVPFVVSTIQPEVITVYSFDKAQEISLAAQQAGRCQNILLKFYRSTDRLYVNQEAGFPLELLAEIIAQISQLPNINIMGLTHFPCFLYDAEEDSTLATPNMETLRLAKQHADELGYQLEQLNCPSSTSCETIPLIKQLGGTHGEPGHALTGTTPSNRDGSQPENIAMLYITEVSHQFGNNSYCFGGGYYHRCQLEKGLIREQLPSHTEDKLVTVSNDDDSNIDYHLKLDYACAVGTPVVMAFRTQIFVTRSDIALVEGISTATPKLLGIYDSLGNEVHHG